MWGLVVGGLIVWGARVVRIPKEVRGDRGVRIYHFPYSVLPPPVLFCPFVSRLPPFIVFLPLSCKSRCLTSYSNREGVLWPSVRNKKLCYKSNHSALSSVIIEAAFLRHKFTPSGKIFSVLWTTVVRSALPGRSSMDGFFPTTSKNTETDQNGLWPASYPDVSLSMKMCAQRKAGRWSLTWRHLTWLALSFLRRISTASETDETLTRLTLSPHTCTCVMPSHSCRMGRFPIS